MLAMGSWDVVRDDEGALSVDDDEGYTPSPMVAGLDGDAADDGPEPIFALLGDDVEPNYPPPAAPPWTLQRIAKAAGVSTKTVQRALHGELVGLVETRREPTPGKQGPGELVARLVEIDEDGRRCFSAVVRGVMHTYYSTCVCGEPAELPPGRGRRFRAAPPESLGFAGPIPVCPSCAQLRRADRVWRGDAARLLDEVTGQDLMGERPAAVVADRLRDRPGVTPNRVARLQKKITGQRAAFARAAGCRRQSTPNG